MKRPLPKRSNLFLMEMILAIFFFSLASAVCMQLFAQAKLLTQKTSAQNHAIIQTKNAVSIFESGDGTLSSLQEAYPDSHLSDSTLTIYFNENWIACNSETAQYKMQIQLNVKSTQLSQAAIWVCDTDKAELFSLKATCYHPIKAVIE